MNKYFNQHIASYVLSSAKISQLVQEISWLITD